MSKHPTISQIRAGLAVTALSLFLTSCVSDRSTGPEVTEVQFAKGGSGPQVEATDPVGAPQDTTLDVFVFGSGFDNGSEVSFTLDGVATASVRTNTTTFVNRKELRANITISLDAVEDLYDVEVLTSKGKKGTGADLFQVVQKGESVGGPPPDDVPVTITLSDFGAGTIGSDALGAYEDGIDGVSAFVFQGDHLNVDIDLVGKGKNATAVRTICFDFTDRVDNAIGLGMPDDPETGMPIEQLCADPLWNTSDQRALIADTAVTLTDMAPDETIGLDSRFIFGFDGSQYKVRFGNKESETTCPLMDESLTRLTATALDNDGQVDGWFLDATDKIATVLRAPPRQGFNECVGRYRMSWSATLRVIQP